VAAHYFLRNNVFRLFTMNSVRWKLFKTRILFSVYLINLSLFKRYHLASSQRRNLHLDSK